MRAFSTEVRQTASELRTAGDSAKAGLMAQLNAQSSQLNRAAGEVRQYGAALKASLNPAELGLAASVGVKGFEMLREAAAGFYRRPVGRAHRCRLSGCRTS